MILRKRTAKAKKSAKPYIDLSNCINIHGFRNLEKEAYADNSLNLPFNICEDSGTDYAECILIVSDVPSDFLTDEVELVFDTYYYVMDQDGSTYYTPTDDIFNFYTILNGYDTDTKTAEFYLCLTLQNIPEVGSGESYCATPNIIGRYYLTHPDDSGGWDIVKETLNDWHSTEFVNLGFDYDDHSWMSDDTEAWIDYGAESAGYIVAKDGTTVYFGLKNFMLRTSDNDCDIETFIDFDGQELTINDVHIDDPKDHGGIKFVMYPWTSDMGDIRNASMGDSYEYDDGALGTGCYIEFGPVDNSGVYSYGSSDEGYNDVIRFIYPDMLSMDCGGYFQTWSYGDDQGPYVPYASTAFHKQSLGSSDTPWVDWITNIQKTYASGNWNYEYMYIDSTNIPGDGGVSLKAIFLRAGTDYDSEQLYYDSPDYGCTLPISFFGERNDTASTLSIYSFALRNYTATQIAYQLGDILLYQEDMTSSYENYFPLTFEVLASYFDDPETGDIAAWSCYGKSRSTCAGDWRYNLNEYPWYEGYLEPGGNGTASSPYNPYEETALIPVGLYSINISNNPYDKKVFGSSKTINYNVGRIDSNDDEISYTTIDYCSYDEGSNGIAIYSNNNILTPVASYESCNYMNEGYDINIGHCWGVHEGDRIRFVWPVTRYIEFDDETAGGLFTYSLGFCHCSGITSTPIPTDPSEVGDDYYYSEDYSILAMQAEYFNYSNWSYYRPIVYLYTYSSIGNTTLTQVHTSYIKVRISTVSSGTDTIYVDMTLRWSSDYYGYRPLILFSNITLPSALITGSICYLSVTYMYNYSGNLSSYTNYRILYDDPSQPSTYPMGTVISQTYQINKTNSSTVLSSRFRKPVIRYRSDMQRMLLLLS